MKRAAIACLVLLLCCRCFASGAQIGKMPWNASNCAKLNSSDKAAVVDFVNGLRNPGVLERLDPYSVGQFRWVDLVGNGGCELLFTTHYPAISFLTIYWQQNPGFSSQSLMGVADLKNGIRDLDGDGKKEIIIDSYLDSTGAHLGSVILWPQVYRLEGEKYVPASRDFPQFYDLKILPKLDKEIAETPTLQTVRVAALEIQRDKILRVLGRDPNAGLEKARYWMTSDDPRIVWDAYLVFNDIPGHEAEAKAAKETEAKVSRRWMAEGRNKQ